MNTDTALDLAMMPTMGSLESWRPWHHGRHWAAMTAEPAKLRAGTKRARAWTLAMREAGASDVELAPIYQDRRGRVGVHVHVCASMAAPKGYAGAWRPRMAAVHLAAVEALHGAEAAAQTRAAFEAAGVRPDSIIWVAHLIPGLTDKEAVMKALDARERAAAAAFQQQQKAAAEKKTTTKKKATRKKAAPKKKAAAKKKAARK